MQLGLILTSAKTLASLETHTRALRADVLKVVTGWGLPWTKESRRAALRLAPAVVVRTVAGDPSYERGPAHPYGLFPLPEWKKVVAEVHPFWEDRDPARPFWIEVGNEPLLDALPGHPVLEAYGWAYRYELAETIRACRAAFPGARIIAPAHIQNHQIRIGGQANGQAWMTTICAGVYRQCDALGLHAYSAEQAARGLKQLREIVGEDRPIWLTEFALNEPLADAERGRRYAELLRVLPVAAATLYHLDEFGGTDPAHFSANYRLTAPALAATRAAWDAPPRPPTPAPAPVPPAMPPTPQRPPIVNVAMSREALERGRPHGPVRALVMHATAGRAPNDLNWLKKGGSATSPVSCHYYIDKAGRITQLVADHDTAWHAGISRWNGLEVWRRTADGTQVPSLNTVSIGIELENLNTGTDPYPPAQYEAAVALARYLAHTHRIRRADLVRHLDVSPGRKTDPAGFPWAQFVADVYEGLQ